MSKQEGKSKGSKSSSSIQGLLLRSVLGLYVGRGLDGVWNRRRRRGNGFFTRDDCFCLLRWPAWPLTSDPMDMGGLTNISGRDYIIPGGGRWTWSVVIVGVGGPILGMNSSPAT